MTNDSERNVGLDSGFFDIAAMHNALQELQFARESESRREAAALAQALARRVRRGPAEQQ